MTLFIHVELSHKESQLSGFSEFPMSDPNATLKELFAGSVGVRALTENQGMVQVLTGQPFDTVKVQFKLKWEMGTWNLT